MRSSRDLRKQPALNKDAAQARPTEAAPAAGDRRHFGPMPAPIADRDQRRCNAIAAPKRRNSPAPALSAAAGEPSSRQRVRPPRRLRRPPSPPGPDGGGQPRTPGRAAAGGHGSPSAAAAVAVAGVDDARGRSRGRCSPRGAAPDRVPLALQPR
jgi:hypothetical protein